MQAKPLTATILSSELGWIAVAGTSDLSAAWRASLFGTREVRLAVPGRVPLFRVAAAIPAARLAPTGLLNALWIKIARLHVALSGLCDRAVSIQ